MNYPELKSVYQINDFSDHKEYIGYSNRWHICQRNNGEVSLVNEQDPQVRINSISYWKIAKKSL